MALSPHAFSGHLQDKAVGLFTDNTTVTFYIYINKQWAGGRVGGELHVPADRMDPGASDSSAYLAQLVLSNGGPVRHEIQPPPGDISAGPPQRCLSSLPSSSEGHQESPVGSVNHDFDGPEVACTTVVSRSPGTLARFSCTTQSRSQIPGSASRRHSPSQPASLGPSRLASVQNRCRH